MWYSFGLACRMWYSFLNSAPLNSKSASMSLNATLLSRRQPDSKDNILLHYAHLSLHKPGALWLLPLDTRKYQPGKPLWLLPLDTRKYQPGKPLETLMFRLGALVIILSWNWTSCNSSWCEQEMLLQRNCDHNWRSVPGKLCFYIPRECDISSSL